MKKLTDILIGFLFALGTFFMALGVMSAVAYALDHITTACAK